MSEEMTREQAIEYFRNKTAFVDGKEKQAYEMAILAIALVSAEGHIMEKYSDCLWHEAYERGKRETLSAEPMQWIPVTESLPKESDGTVLVCMPDVSPYNEAQPYPNCEISQRVRTGTHSEHSGRWYYENGGVGGNDPIAWMPLPKPWSGKESE